MSHSTQGFIQGLLGEGGGRVEKENPYTHACSRFGGKYSEKFEEVEEGGGIAWGEHPLASSPDSPLCARVNYCE